MSRYDVGSWLSRLQILVLWPLEQTASPLSKLYNRHTFISSVALRKYLLELGSQTWTLVQ